MSKLIADTTPRSKACRINLTKKELDISGFKAGDDIEKAAIPGEIKLTKAPKRRQIEEKGVSEKNVYA